MYRLIETTTVEEANEVYITKLALSVGRSKSLATFLDDNRLKTSQQSCGLGSSRNCPFKIVIPRVSAPSETDHESLVLRLCLQSCSLT